MAKDHQPVPESAARCCGRCRHFDNRPETLEKAYPGMTAMGSGHASVRVQDGLCLLHDRYLSYHDVCGDFAE